MLINLRGKEPIFVQIKNQIINYIELGILKKDERLPSVRVLAEELGINPNTVQKAYSDLESDGYVYMMNKKGVYVSDRESRNTENHRELLIMINKIKNMNISKEELLETIKEVYK